MHEPVAVLGIGAMGHGMATSALRAGIRTIVWNRNAAATRDLAALGAEVAETAADAARQAAIIVTMVTDIDAVISIARDQGMLAALAPGVRSGSRQAPSAWQESSALPSWWMSSVLT
jgi:3-hydroxyisobutyrate dehydrogenase